MTKRTTLAWEVRVGRIAARAILAMGILLTPSGCGPDQLGLDQRSAFELSSGTSFGMCGGYCVTEMTIDSVSVTMVERSQRNEDMPDRTRTLPIERSEWEQLQALVDTVTVRGLEGVHGCPDCADGGAEWIEVGLEQPVRITFEYGHDLEGIERLQAAIRELRERFPR